MLGRVLDDLHGPHLRRMALLPLCALRVRCSTFGALLYSNDRDTIPVRSSEPYGQACTDLNSVCYNSVTEHGQMFWVAVPAGGFGAVWLTVHLLSICPLKLDIFHGLG